jgi:hypothetical protein
MREIGWLEKEFQAASKRVSEWPEWKKEIEAKSSGLTSESKEPISAESSDENPETAD